MANLGHVRNEDEFNKPQDTLNKDKKFWLSKLPSEMKQNEGLFNIIPGGVSIATDISCKEIIHNAVAAEFLRIQSECGVSHTAAIPLKVAIFHKGKKLLTEELPIQQAAWYGEYITGYELEFIWSDGLHKSSIWSACPLYSCTGKIIGAVATHKDITNEKCLQEEFQRHNVELEQLVRERTAELEAANQKISEILESINSGFCALDKNLQFIYINKCAIDYMNSPLESFIGKSIWDVFPAEKEWQDAFSKVLKDQQTFRGELFSKTNQKWYGIHIYPTRDGLSAHFRDITERRQLEQEMTKLDRLNVVGEMAASIGHEVRNPMTTVRGFLQMIKMKQQYQELHDTFDIMIDELDRANSIISEYLTLAKNKTANLEPASLNSIIRTLYPLVQADALRLGHDICLNLDDLPEILLNEKDIRQLILNIVRNGIEAMETHGVITIKTYIENENIVLAISDTGKGMSQEIREKLGTPFLTTKDSGTGIGLSVCYRIVERHKATIHVETSLNGTTFFIHFPAK